MASKIGSEIDDFALSLAALVRKIRASAPSETDDLTWTQRSVMSRLYREGAATTADLARAENVKPQSMSAAIGVLENLGYVERKAHPTDRRQVNIALTAKGSQNRKAVSERKHIWLVDAISKLDRREQAQVFEVGKLLQRMVDEA